MWLFGYTTIGGGALLSILSLDQQAELIYICYFNRSADPGGFSFWEDQDATAQAHGQGAIANSFAPQPETIAIYPFLSTPSPNFGKAPGRGLFFLRIGGW